MCRRASSQETVYAYLVRPCKKGGVVVTTSYECVAVTDIEYIQLIRRHMRSAYLMNDAKVAELLPGFLQVLQQHLDRLQESLLSGDIQALGHSSHTIKGALLNLGLVDLAAVALRIEEGCRHGNRQTNYRALVAMLEQEILSFAALEVTPLKTDSSLAS